MLKKHEEHIENALNTSQEKKKEVGERNKDAEKRNSDNYSKFIRLVEKKQEDTA